MRYVSTAVELIGTLITAYGLMVAYGRIRGLPERLRELWRRVARRPAHVTGEMGATMVAAQMSASAEVEHNYRLDETAPVQLQLAQLLVYIRDSRTFIDEATNNIGRLDDAIDAASTHADDVAAQALTDARAEIDDLGRRLDEVQAADLSVAVVGVLITALGIALSFCA